MDAISTPCVLLVEGKDEKAICELLLKNFDADFAKKIEIRNAEGGSDLRAAAEGVDVVSGFAKLERLVVLVDAEEKPEQTFEYWQMFQQQFESMHPTKKFDFLVLPSNTEKGSLDTVFLRSLDVTKDSVAQCALDFVDCVGTNGALSTQARRDKVALVSYINANSKNPYSRLGVALAQTGRNLFDFEHDSFLSLVQLLKRLL